MTAAKTLKIGLVFDDSLDRNDGVAQYVKTLGRWLSTQGHDVSYLVGQTKMRDWHGGTVYSLARNIKISFNANRLSIPLPAKRRLIKELFELEQFDVLHVQTPYSPFMAQRVINYAPSSTVIIGTFHILPAGRLSRWGSRFLRIVYGRSLSRFSSMMSVSPAAAEFAQQAFGVVSSISPDVIDAYAFKTKNVPRNEPRIVFLGRLVKRKGASELIDAYAQLRKRMPEVKLVIAGDGPMRSELEKQAYDLAVVDDVEFLGYIDEVDKPRLLASASIACFPSLYGESFGIVLLEAMAAGAGVVLGGDNPGYRSVLGPKPKLLVNPRNSKEFAKRLEELLTDRQLAKSLHSWQNHRVEIYDVNRVGPEVLGIYRSAIASAQKTIHN